MFVYISKCLKSAYEKTTFMNVETNNAFEYLVKKPQDRNRYRIVQ